MLIVAFFLPSEKIFKKSFKAVGFFLLAILYFSTFIRIGADIGRGLGLVLLTLA